MKKKTRFLCCRPKSLKVRAWTVEKMCGLFTYHPDDFLDLLKIAHGKDGLKAISRRVSIFQILRVTRKFVLTQSDMDRAKKSVCWMAEPHFASSVELIFPQL